MSFAGADSVTTMQLTKTLLTLPMLLTAAWAIEPAGAKVFISTGNELIDNHYAPRRQQGRMDQWPNDFLASVYAALLSHQVPLQITHNRAEADLLLIASRSDHKGGTTYTGHTTRSGGRYGGATTTVTSQTDVDSVTTASLYDPKAQTTVWTWAQDKWNVSDKATAGALAKKLKEYLAKGAR